jgi:Sulfotransferase family
MEQILDVLPFPFIVARGRSGTTLLRAMFNAHPDVAVPPESNFAVQFASTRRKYERHGDFDIDRFTRDLFDHYAFGDWKLSDHAIREALKAGVPADVPDAIRTLYRTFARQQGKARYANQTPSYVLHIELLAETFPEARFIHLIRDGRHVALSYMDADFGPSSLPQAAAYWNRAVRAGRSAGDRIGPHRYREIRYEDLIADPEIALRDLCGFVDVPFDGAMLHYFERTDPTPPRNAKAHPNVHKPPLAGLRDWREALSDREVKVFDALAGDLLEDLGYERGRSGSRLAAFVGAWYRSSWHVRRVTHGVISRFRRQRRRLARRLPSALGGGYLQEHRS